MRRFIIYLISLGLIFSCGFHTQTLISLSASTEYRRIITEDTPFYSDKGGTSLLFYLPYTYYVKVLEYGEILSHVECFGTGRSIALDGYVPSNMLFNDDLPVPSPYLEKEIVTLSTAVLYSDKGMINPIQYVFSSRELVYYGQLKNMDGSVIFYVGYNNRLGYVSESAIVPFEIELHPNELTFLQPEPQPPDEQIESPTDESTLLTVRMIIVICLLFAGIIALFVAIKNKPKNNATNFYDENEYE